MSDEPADATDHVIIARAALEALVFAPIGLGAKLVDDAPEAIRRVRQELSNARLIGRLTVEQGAARLRDRMMEHDAPARADDAGEGVGDVDPGMLAIAGYDQLPAIEIVGKLAALTPAQRKTIAAHETAHRQRRTVLGKIAQLAE